MTIDSGKVRADYPLDWLIFFNNAVGHSTSSKRLRKPGKNVIILLLQILTRWQKNGHLVFIREFSLEILTNRLYNKLIAFSDAKTRGT
jgi:hypothetical protein